MMASFSENSFEDHINHNYKLEKRTSKGKNVDTLLEDEWKNK